MADAADKWEKIERAFKEGVPPTEICAKYRISVRDLLARARQHGWKHGSDKEAPAAEAPPLEPTKLPVPVRVDKATRDALRAAMREAATDIVEQHKLITKHLRDSLFELISEFEAARTKFVSFLDPVLSTDPKIANEQLKNALSAYKVLDSMYRGLVASSTTLIGAERLVWGLDLGKDGDGQKPAEETYLELLNEIQRPLAPRELPDNVFAFERKIARTAAQFTGS